MEIGLIEFNQSSWPSLERTRKFYIQALSKENKTKDINPINSLQSNDSLDAIVNFAGVGGWDFERHPSCPILYGIHGGAILNQDFLRAHLHKLESTDVLIVNCKSDISIFEKMFSGGGPTFCHLPLPIDEIFYKAKDKTQARNLIELPKFDFIIGFVGRLLPQKNLHQFLNLLAKLKKILYPKTIGGLIVGNYWVDYPVLDYVSEEYPTLINNLIEKYDISSDVLYFPAKLSDEELALCYKAMDVLVHPTNSIDENYGYAPIEAMACGTPVVGAAYGGLKDTIKSGYNGYLMPTWCTHSGIRMDILSGLNMIAKLLMDPSLLEKYSKASIDVSLEYSFSNCSNILQNSVKQVVEQRKYNLQKPLTIAKKLPAQKDYGYLPPLKIKWGNYYPQVSDYVSTKIQVLTDNTVIYLSGNVLHLDDTTCYLDDPTWPATYPITLKEKHIISICQNPINAKLILKHPGANKSLLYKLIRMGILCFSESEIIYV